MLKKDENFLLHAYKIQDTAKSLMKVLEKDLRFKDKQIVKNLDATLNKIPRKFGLISNNASLSGLASRHRHTARKPSTNMHDLKQLVDDSLTIFGEVLYILYTMHFILNNSPNKLNEDDNYYKFELIIDALI